jgi:hypothetical protein
MEMTEMTITFGKKQRYRLAMMSAEEIRTAIDYAIKRGAGEEELSELRDALRRRTVVER